MIGSFDLAKKCCVRFSSIGTRETYIYSNTEIVPVIVLIITNNKTKENGGGGGEKKGAHTKS